MPDAVERAILAESSFDRLALIARAFVLLAPLSDSFFSVRLGREVPDAKAFSNTRLDDTGAAAMDPTAAELLLMVCIALS